jgi:hypothetical protein
MNEYFEHGIWGENVLQRVDYRRILPIIRACGSSSTSKFIQTPSMHSPGAVEMSKAALQFANAAKRVTMQPVVNEVLNERARMRRLQIEIDSLRQQLVRINNNNFHHHYYYYKVSIECSWYAISADRDRQPQTAAE